LGSRNPSQGGWFVANTLRALEQTTGISHSRLAYAKMVLEFAPDLALIYRCGHG
jgi:hypothetical protein